MNVILTSFKTSNSLVVRWVRWENYHQPNLSSNLVSFIGSHSFFFCPTNIYQIYITCWTFQVALEIRNRTASARDTGGSGSILGLERSPGGRCGKRSLVGYSL